MQINTDNFSTIRAAEYDESTDMLRMVIICRPTDLVCARANIGAPGDSSILADLEAVNDVFHGVAG